MSNYDVAILGWWHNSNYGSISTYYALNKAITDMGLSTLLVQESLGYPSRSVLPDDAPALSFARRQGFNYTDQLHYSANEDLNAEADTFVVGSDQLWNPYIPRINDDLFLGFTAAEKKRVAYGTSIGNFNQPHFQSEHFGPDFEHTQRVNLERFDWISMREDDGIEYMKKTFNLDTPQVVDPVFLIDPENYHNLASETTMQIEGPYLLAFILDPSEEKRRGVQAVADKLGLSKIAVFTDANFRQLARAKEIFNGPQYLFDVEIRPENWWAAYRDASYVVTDSFHGTAFAHIFQKPFSVFFNQIRGANRFASLLRLLKLDDSRRIYETDTEQDIINNQNVSFEIDFEPGNSNLLIEREKSQDWLRNAVLSPKKGEKILPGAIMSANQIAVDPTQSDISLRERLTSTPFVYYRRGQRVTPLAKGVRLAENGDITGIPNSVHSFHWHLKGAKLQFQNRNRQATTIFDVSVDQDGMLKIEGPFVPNKKVIHILEQEESWARDIASEIERSQRAVAERIGRNDIERFASAYALKWTSRNRGNARALMMFYAHAVEKGLSHQDFRPAFGKEVIPQLARETNKWLKETLDANDAFFRIGVAVARTYFDKHHKLGVDVSHFWDLFSAEVQREISHADLGLGGVTGANNEREIPPITSIDRGFLDVVYGRRSVREFSKQPVSDEHIKAAVEIAMQAPSVCNRQPARVYQMSDPETIRKALEIQVGFRGFAPPSKLLLVTVDLTAFLYAAERNQAYIDGGLFKMLLLLGLEQVGLGACCLNTAMNPGQQDAIRELLELPPTDALIAFAAVGHYDEATVVPKSKRLPVSEILIHK